MSSSSLLALELAELELDDVAAFAPTSPSLELLELELAASPAAST
jgi:hypothetical protein